MSKASDQEGGIACVGVTVARCLTEYGARAEAEMGEGGRHWSQGTTLILVQDAFQTSLHSFIQLFFQLLLLGHGQLGLVIPHDLVNVRGALCTMQHQCPLLQHPLLRCAPNKPQLQGPDSSGIFTPSVGGHERPLVKAHLGVIIPWTPTQQNGLGTHRGSHVDVQVSSPGCIDCDDSLDMLKVADEILLPFTGISGEGQHQLASGWYFPEGKVMRRYDKEWAHYMKGFERQFQVAERAKVLRLIRQTWVNSHPSCMNVSKLLILSEPLECSRCCRCPSHLS